MKPDIRSGIFFRANDIAPHPLRRRRARWLPESGHRVGSGASFEIYSNTPAETPKEELRTELYVPLA